MSTGMGVLLVSTCAAVHTRSAWLGFVERVQYKLPPEGSQASFDKLDPKLRFGYVLGYARTSPDQLVYDEESRTMCWNVRAIQRVDLRRSWRSTELEALNATLQHMFRPQGPRERLGSATERRGVEVDIHVRQQKRVILCQIDFGLDLGGGWLHQWLSKV